MARCEQKHWINNDERERCEEPATHYCTNCDKQVCEDCGGIWHDAGGCEVREGLRPEPC